MNITPRQLLRVAGAIQAHLLSLQRHRWHRVQGHIGCVEERMSRLKSLRHKLALCESRGWSAAATKVLTQLECLARDLPAFMQDAMRAVQACNLEVPSMADLQRDLAQVEQEFGELTYYPQDEVLAVTTDPIELRDVFLGDFEIQMHVPSLAAMQHGNVYRILALDPHPAAGNEYVTHPHVSDERLCPGDGGAAIHMALSDGRICDFFLLVRSVLTNYNPDSPFISLDSWDGVVCYDCGYVTDPDHIRYCTSCERDFCTECSSYCAACDETACLSCLQTCEACGEAVCPSCLMRCPECDRSLCRSCLEQNLCPCEQERKEADHEEEAEEQDQPSVPATEEA